MLRMNGLESFAFALAGVGLMLPIALPAPGSALGRVNYSHGMHRSVVSNNIVQKMQKEGNFRMFLSALKETDMDTPLISGRGPYTVFAPTDRAFASLSKDSFNKLFQDKTRLKTILKYHIVPRKVVSNDIKFDSLRTLSGDFLMTNISPSKSISIAGAVVTKPDIMCGNGVIHSIDTVLTPLTGMENLAMVNSSEVKSPEVR